MALTNLSNDEYKSKFDLVECPDSEKRDNALKVALDIRKFEIELYWKRTTYFWAFIGATLVAYCEASKIGAGSHNYGYLLQEIFSAAGLIFSFAWLKLNQGSKFWQANWEAHVDYLEDEAQGPLYKVIAQSHNEAHRFLGARPFSVSRVNQWVSFFIFCVWCILVLLSAIQLSPLLHAWASLILKQSSTYYDIMSFVGVAIAIIGCIVIQFCGKSTFAEDLKIRKEVKEIKKKVIKEIQFYLRN